MRRSVLGRGSVGSRVVEGLNDRTGIVAASVATQPDADGESSHRGAGPSSRGSSVVLWSAAVLLSVLSFSSGVTQQPQASAPSPARAQRPEPAPTNGNKQRQEPTTTAPAVPAPAPAPESDPVPVRTVPAEGNVADQQQPPPDGPEPAARTDLDEVEVPELEPSDLDIDARVEERLDELPEPARDMVDSALNTFVEITD